MLKKIVLASIIALGSTAAMADQDIGCGLGTQVWEGKSGLAPKLLAATTNGTSMNQLFGISFGTLGCKGGSAKITAQVAEFVEYNSESLARDMAVGQGESLDVLAGLLNIKAEDKAHFLTVAQSNMAEIYKDNATTADIVVSLHQVLAQDEVLKAYI